MSLLEVNKITPQSGTTLTLGDTGDTINFGSGVLPNFENLTVTGDLTVDTNSLYVDSANNRVGIGTASPADKLHIYTSGNSKIILETTSSVARTQVFGVDNLGNNNYALGSNNNTDTEFWNYKNGYMRFATNSTERMRITSSGLVGIGTSSPSQLLHVYNTGNDIARIETNQTEGRLSLKDATGDAVLKFRNDYRFTNSTGELVRIDSSGRVGIGTTSLVEKLTVEDDNYAKIQIITSSTGHGAGIEFGDSTDDDYGSITQFATAAGEGGRMRFIAGTTETMNLRGGNVGIGDTNPNDYLEINGSGRGLGGLTISNSTHFHAALSFARSSSATARIYITEPAALHTSSLRFQTSDASGSTPNLVNAMVIDENQNVGIGTTTPSQRLDVVGSIEVSDSIYLGGTGSANELDDYEIGSWTPNYSTEGGGESITYDGITAGSYVKIGSLVFITGFIRTDAVSGGSSYLYLGGFPFTNASGTSRQGFIGIARSSAFVTHQPSALEMVSGGTKAFVKFRGTSDGNSDNLLAGNLGTGANANIILFSGAYTIS